MRFVDTTKDGNIDVGTAVCAWNLQEGGKPRSMANTFITEGFTATVTVEPKKETTTQKG